MKMKMKSDKSNKKREQYELRMLDESPSAETGFDCLIVSSKFAHIFNFGPDIIRSGRGNTQEGETAKKKRQEGETFKKGKRPRRGSHKGSRCPLRLQSCIA